MELRRNKMTKIYIAADHGGYELKEKIKNYLNKKRIGYEDFGTYDCNVKDDYPDYAVKVAQKVAKEKHSKGILICGTGTGMCISANKIKGIRASVIYDKYSAKKAKEDNDVNIICLRGREFSSIKAKQITDIWLNAKFSNLARHKRRIQKISKLEGRK